MKPNERPFIEKAANDTRAYIQALLSENERLRNQLAEAEEASRGFAARYVEVEQQNTNLANLYVASYQLHGTLDRQRVLDAIKEVIINLVGSEELAIWELDWKQESLLLLDSFGIDENAWRRLPLDRDAGVIGLCTISGQRFVIGESDVLPSGPQQNLTACIPLMLDHVIIGAIGIFRLLPQKSGFEAVDLELFDLLASHAATALYCTRATLRVAVTP
jgi:GAF domain-containing protein